MLRRGDGPSPGGSGRAIKGLAQPSKEEELKYFQYIALPPQSESFDDVFRAVIEETFQELCRPLNGVGARTGEVGVEKGGDEGVSGGTNEKGIPMEIPAEWGEHWVALNCLIDGAELRQAKHRMKRREGTGVDGLQVERYLDWQDKQGEVYGACDSLIL